MNYVGSQPNRARAGSVEPHRCGFLTKAHNHEKWIPLGVARITADAEDGEILDSESARHITLEHALLEEGHRNIQTILVFTQKMRSPSLIHHGSVWRGGVRGYRGV